MESITIKVDPAMAKAIEKAMKPLYSTKTEFIREAIRDKIKEQEKKDRLKLLQESLGKGKGTSRTDRTDKEIRREVGEEFIKKMGWD